MSIDTSHIFLFGHRKQSGKNFCVEVIEDMFRQMNISYTSTYFAKMLKKHTAERYGLDFDRMGNDTYKNSKPEHLGGLTIRDVLIKEGCGARNIWQNIWAYPVYTEILLSNSRIGLISDFRYPNEYNCFNECFNIVNKNGNLLKPKLYKVLVHRPDGKFVNDGADDQLPDLDTYWDFTILNDDTTQNWKQNLERQLKNMVESTIGV